jgi:transposase
VLADWLNTGRIDTVVMESTGVYWILVSQILERADRIVKLVNARHVKNLPAAKPTCGTESANRRWLERALPT